MKRVEHGTPDCLVGCVQYPVAAAGALACEQQLAFLGRLQRGPANEFLDAFRSFFEQHFHGFDVAETVARAQRVLQMETDFVLIAEQRPVRRYRRLASLTFGQDDDGACLRQFNGGPQPGDTGANHQELSLGWNALHKRGMLPLARAIGAGPAG